MRAWRNQRGDVPVGCLVGLAVLAIIALIAIKVAPEISRTGEFEKDIRAAADRANRVDYSDKKIHRIILQSAERLGLPIGAEDIVIKRSKASIRVTVVYDLPIEFPGYTYVWHKNIDEERPLF